MFCRDPSSLCKINITLLSLNTNITSDLNSYGKTGCAGIYGHQGPCPSNLCSAHSNSSPCPWNRPVGRETKAIFQQGRPRGGAKPEAAATGLPWPTQPSLPRAQVKPLVEVLLPHVAAIQHEDIKDVDGTNLPLGLTLEGQVHCPPCQELAWDPLGPPQHSGLHST